MNLFIYNYINYSSHKSFRRKWKMIDLNENEIMSEWDVNRYPEPLVAVRCMAYNHENIYQMLWMVSLVKKQLFRSIFLCMMIVLLIILHILLKNTKKVS